MGSEGESFAAASSGGSGMNAVFTLILTVLCLHIYDSHWFQRVGLASCKSWCWDQLGGYLRRLRGWFTLDPSRKLESEVEFLILETNGTQWAGEEASSDHPAGALLRRRKLNTS